MKSEKVWNYLFLLCFVFVWYRDAIIIIYSHWNQYYPNASYHPYLYKSSIYSPILFHIILSFIIVKTLILSNIVILYIYLKLWQVRLLSVLAFMFVLSNTMNPSEWSRFVVLSILVESTKISEFAKLHMYYLKPSFQKLWKHIMMSHLLTYNNRHCGGIPASRYPVRYLSSSRRYWSIPSVWKGGSRQFTFGN